MYWGNDRKFKKIKTESHYLAFCIGFNIRQPKKREETSQKMAFQELRERQQNNPAGDL